MGELSSPPPAFRRVPHDQAQMQRLLRWEHYKEKIFCPCCGHLHTALVGGSDQPESQAKCQKCKGSFVFGIAGGVKYCYSQAAVTPSPA